VEGDSARFAAAASPVVLLGISNVGLPSVKSISVKTFMAFGFSGKLICHV
jgi:hypothetical protein